MDTRRWHRHLVGIVTIAFTATLLLSSCTSTPKVASSPASTPQTSTDVSSARPTSASSAPTVPAVPATSSTIPSTTSDLVAQASAKATQSCQTWLTGSHMIAADQTPTLRQAAQIATTASTMDSRWSKLADDMTFVSSLPLTDNSKSQVSQARTDQTEMQQTCAPLGVQIPL